MWHVSRRRLRSAMGVIVMISLGFYSRLLVAQEFDLESLVGEDWYGLYMNGQKAGYSRSEFRLEDDGSTAVIEEARFQVNMVSVRQNMQTFSRRVYGPDGALKEIVYRVEDPAGRKDFHAVVEGDKMVISSNVGGTTSETTLPKPDESLSDALEQVRLITEGAESGETITFSLFDPMFKKEITGESRVVGVEQRVFNGAPTTVYCVKTKLDMMGVESTSYVAEDGTVLEDTIANMVTMRLEPEKMAKDVNYSNDVIVSNAAMVDLPIADPRTRDTLELRLTGPIGKEHTFNDARQTIEKTDGKFEFTGRRIKPEDLEPVKLPITEKSVQKWLEPTVFVQSDNEKLIDKAHEIVGDEKDAFEAVRLLCHWVHRNVRTNFSAQLTNALEVLDRLEGDCTEYSILFIGLARAAGIPAREVAGLIYMEADQPGFYFHQWAKVWVGEWIDVDPTFDQPLADATHIKLAEGDLYEQARLIPVIGRIEVEVVGASPGK